MAKSKSKMVTTISDVRAEQGQRFISATPPGRSTSLPTSSLVFGQDHPELAMNVRKTAREEGISALAESIIADGLLQPLLVWRDTAGDGRDYVVDGSRRLSALLTIADTFPERFETVPALLIEGGTADDAMAKSLAANILQVPLHPVDQYEAFSTIRDASADKEPTAIAAEIAQRYGTTPIVVMRRLALGNLAPEIRKAWRAGDIDADDAKAFTLEPDQKRQATIFKKLGRNVNAWQVRQTIRGDQGDAAKQFALVGVEGYEAAGGIIVRDLFTEDGSGDRVSDLALLKKLVDVRVEERAAALIEAGWAWASAPSDLPRDWSYAWKRDGLNAKKATDAQKAASGVVIDIAADGRWALEYGVRKPGVRAVREKPGKGTKAGKADKADAPEPTLSQNMVRTLQRQATVGLAAALKEQPDIALAAMLAAFASGDVGPVRVQAQGLEVRENGTPDEHDQGDFAAAFKVIAKKSRAEMMPGVASIAAAAVDLVMAGDPMPLQDRDAIALASALNTKALNKALREAFMPGDYFEGVSKAFCRDAIVEAMGLEGYANISHGSKADISAFAIANVPKTGWMPPELRAPGYDGPGAKKGKR